MDSIEFFAVSIGIVRLDRDLEVLARIFWSLVRVRGTKGHDPE